MLGSILDRLIDLEPESRGEPAQYRTITYSHQRSSVERDLENLLNTRCYPYEFPDSCPALRKSLLAYGLSDFTSRNPSVPAVCTVLRQEIERAIMTFEPRLRNVSVRVELPPKGERRVKFRINALLMFEEEGEPVCFDTFFDSNRCEYSINRQR